MGRGKARRRASARHSVDVEGGETARAGARNERWLVGLGAALTLVALVRHVEFLRSAGPLWRDEVNTLRMATVSSLAMMWSNLGLDSFPPLSFVTLRAWAATLEGFGDGGLRLYGFLVGLSIVLALWLAGRAFGLGAPLVSLSLFAVHPIVVVYGDSIRPHGLGVLLPILALTATWGALHRASLARYSLAAVACVLCVQSLYQSAALVFGICMAAAGVCFMRLQRSRALVFILIGVATALSLLPYGGALREASALAPVVGATSTGARVWQVLLPTLGAGVSVLSGIWLVVAALVPLVYWFFRGSGGETERTARTYVLAAVGLAVVAYLGLLTLVGVPTQSWYYLPMLGLVALAADVALAATVHHARVRHMRPIVAVGAGLGMIVLTWGALERRQSSVDLVAEVIQRRADPADFVVVNPWYLGVSFQHYYQGAASWETVPPMTDHAIHRYDLLRSAMAREAVLAPVLQRAAETLQSGHRVWLVGTATTPRSGVVPAPPSPAPDPVTGWDNAPYLAAWSDELGYFLRSRAAHAEMVTVPVDRPVNPLEHPALYVMEGWNEES